MKNRFNQVLYGKFCYLTGIFVLVVLSVSIVQGQPHDSHHGFMLKGPWELVVQKGMESQSLLFPVAIDQENKPQVLSKVLPILGSPVKLKIVQYLPDLKMETYIEEKKNSDGAASLVIEGPGFRKQMSLSTDDPGRRSLSSQFGGISILKLNNIVNFEENIKQLTEQDSVGILTVRLNDASTPAEPQDFIVHTQQEITVANTQHRITILEYFPHFSRDLKKKKDMNLSEKPVNPAIKVKVDGDGKSYEKWLFSEMPNYGRSGHPGSSESAEALEMVFTYVGKGKDSKNHWIVAGARNEPVMLIWENGETASEKLVVGKKYPLGGDYYFIVEKVSANAVLKERWSNKSETLKAPAIVVQVNNGGVQEEVVLELNKPKHIKSANEMMVLIFRPQQPKTEKKD